MGPDAMIFLFWMLSFKLAFSLSSFTFIKRLFSFSLLYAIRVMLPPGTRSVFLHIPTYARPPPPLAPACISRLYEAQARIKIRRRNINNLRYAIDITLMAENEELKSLLMKVKEESEKVGLKLNI